MASYSDDFNRADGALGGNWGGSEAALFDVNGNRMRMPGSNAAGLAGAALSLLTSIGSAPIGGANASLVGEIPNTDPTTKEQP